MTWEQRHPTAAKFLRTPLSMLIVLGVAATPWLEPDPGCQTTQRTAPVCSVPGAEGAPTIHRTPTYYAHTPYGITGKVS